MIGRISLAYFAGLLFAIAAHAQSFDGVYRGQITTTVCASPERGPKGRACAVGNSLPTEFRVQNSVIRVKNRGNEWSAPVRSDGSFDIRGRFHSLVGQGGLVNQQWQGVIKGSRIDGTQTATGRGGHQQHTFTATRQAR